MQIQSSAGTKRCLPTVVLLAAIVAAPAIAQKPITVKDEIKFGVEMAEEGLWSEALFRFQQAEKMGGATAAVYNNMAVAYEALGAFDKAREHYQKALELESESPGLRRNYSRFVEFYQAFNPEGETEDDDSGESGDPVPSESQADEPSQPADDG